MNIAIAAYNRIDSLTRLLQSVKACMGDYVVEVYVFLDLHPESEEQSAVMSFLSGDKSINLIPSESHIGLKANMHRIFDWAAAQTQPTLVLEDDLYVSPATLHYATEAVNYYRDQEDIGMISCYHQHYQVLTEFPFIPMLDGNDIYMMQFPASSGFILTPKMAQRYVAYISHENASDLQLLPAKLRYWPASSWKKIFAAYLCKEQLYTVFPRVSFSSNFGESGKHHQKQSHYFQSPLAFDYPNGFRYALVKDSVAKYDVYMEWLPDAERFPMLKDICFDLNGMKEKAHLQGEYVISLRKVKHPVKSFDRALKPQEMNVVQDIHGSTFHQFPISSFDEAIADKDAFSRMVDYYYIFSSKRLLAGYLKDFLF